MMKNAKSTRLTLNKENKKLAREWHPTKNSPLTPKDVTYGSGRRVWWVCQKGHEWKTIIGARSKGSECPYCAGYKVSKDNCLQTINPKLAREWHPTKNSPLTPKDVSAGSEEKVWWKCQKGHEWQAAIANRRRSRGCQYCSGRKVSKDNCLQTVKPALSREWHPTKNVPLTPKDVTCRAKKKVWWKCRKGHEWKTKISHRNDGSGCPYCSGKKVCKDNCLQTVNPGLAREWHPTKNASLTTEDVTRAANKKVWWKCQKGHEWQAIITSRSSGIGCPYCAGKKVSKDNCLQTINPGLAREWHPTKNTPLTPKDVTRGSNKKVWWICRKGHKWEAIIISRSKGIGCPYCAGKKVCKDNSLQTINPKLAREWHPTKNTLLRPKDVTWGSSKKVWWKCQKGHEWTEAVIFRFRSRSNRCPYCAGYKASKDNCLQTINPKLAREWHPAKNRPLTPKDVTCVTNKKVWWKCRKGHEWETRVSHRSRGTGCPYCAGKKVCKDNCLKTISPRLAREWHPAKNTPLTPKDVVSGSSKKVWWKCSKGHEWETKISSRNRGSGCPYYSGVKVCKDNCLQTISPRLAREWHPTKNAPLTPKDVTCRANKKVWWKCQKGHEWEEKITERYRGSVCLYCLFKKASPVNPTIKRAVGNNA